MERDVGPRCSKTNHKETNFARVIVQRRNDQIGDLEPDIRFCLSQISVRAPAADA